MQLEVVRSIDCWVKVLGLLIAPNLRIDDWNDCEWDASNGKLRAACASCECASNSHEIFVLDEGTRALGLHVFDHKAIFNTQRLCDALLLFVFWCVVLDGPEVKLHESLLILVPSGLHSILSLLS